MTMIECSADSPCHSGKRHNYVSTVHTHTHASLMVLYTALLMHNSRLMHNDGMSRSVGMT